MSPCFVVASLPDFLKGPLGGPQRLVNASYCDHSSKFPDMRTLRATV